MQHLEKCLLYLPYSCFYGSLLPSLLKDRHIDPMTHKWLNQGQSPPRIPEFCTLTKIHKAVPFGRPIVSGSGGPTERISSFVVSLLQPIAKKQESYIKDTTPLLNFIENTPLPDNAILASLDVCSLYTTIAQQLGIDVICQYYEEHYQSNPPIPTSSTSSLRELMRLILNNTLFNSMANIICRPTEQQ